MRKVRIPTIEAYIHDYPHDSLGLLIIGKGSRSQRYPILMIKSPTLPAAHSRTGRPTNPLDDDDCTGGAGPGVQAVAINGCCRIA